MSITTTLEKLITKEATGSQAFTSSFVKVSSLTFLDSDNINKQAILRGVKITATQSSPAALNLIVTLDSAGDDVVYASGNVGGTAGQATANTKSFQFSINKWLELGTDGALYFWLKGGTTTWTKTSATIEL